MSGLHGGRSRWPLVAARTGWGVLLLARPERVARAVQGGAATDDLLDVDLIRVLGARELLEAAAEAVWPGSRRWATRVDLTHAASMVLVAVRSPRRRREALTSAAAAVAMTVLARATAPR